MIGLQNNWLYLIDFLLNHAGGFMYFYSQWQVCQANWQIHSLARSGRSVGPVWRTHVELFPNNLSEELKHDNKVEAPFSLMRFWLTVW